MNVYFVPLGAGRLEPYFEHEDGEVPEELPAGTGFLGRMRARFAETLREAERQRHERTHQPPASALARLQRSLMRWIAERVAEQRLLWNLRSVDDAVLHVPDDMDLQAAEQAFRQSLQRDGDRHLRLLALHSLGLIASAPVALIPGPNVFGYLFTFTVVGHFLSYRGARRGNGTVRWRVVANADLSEVGRALTATPPERRRLLHDVSQRLHLPRLVPFVERMTVPTA